MTLNQRHFHLGEVRVVLSGLRSLGKHWEISSYVQIPILFPLCPCRGLASDEKQSAVELDAVLQRHQDMQEKLAEEMLSLARSLKNNTLAAQNVIKQDNQVV